MNLHSLLKCLPQYNIDKEGNPFISSIEMDSRQVKEGSLFICIKGFTVDGHNYVNDAVHKGAVAIVAEEKLDVSVPVVVVSDTKRAMAVLSDFFYEHPTHQLHLIGVTGTNGKTTVTHILEKLFRDRGQKTGLIGTINMKIGDKTYDVNNTTPESLLLQKTFKEMIDEEVQSAFMEVSSHALHMGRVRGCDFNVAVFTNLTQDHLDYHETMEEYRRAKGLLFSQLGNRYDPDNPKFAILNIDDPATEQYCSSTSAHVVTYGIDRQADIMATNIKISNQGTTFRLKTIKGDIDIKIQLVGKFSIYNVLAATAAALVSGINLEEVKESLETLKGVPGRFEVVNGGQDFTVIVDYAHTPDSLENVLTTVKQFAKQQVFVVIGCGGDRDRKKRPLMAEIASNYADFPIFTSDNPRTEDPDIILQDMEKGVKGRSYKVIKDRKEAISYAINHAKKDDVIVIAGKGHETYQEIGKQKFDFDDRLVVRTLLKERME